MRVKESFYRDIARIIIWYPVRWLIIILPTRIDFLIFKILGNIAFMIQKSKREMIIDQFSKYLKFTKSGMLKNFAGRYFENHFIDRLHIFLYPRLRSLKNRTILDLTGEENLRKPLAEGRGVVLLHGHFGPVQLQLLELASRGYNISQIGLLSDDKLSFTGKHIAYRLRSRYENQIGAAIIRADRFLRKAFETLNDGGIIMMAGDGAGAGKFIGKFTSADFFGEKVPFPTGPYSLASKTGAVILPITIFRMRYDHYCINIFEPFSEDSELETPDLSKQVQKFADFLEDKIKSYPSQWHFWDDFVPGKLISEKDEKNEIHCCTPNIQ